MKTLIIYHANCMDGFGAAWAAYTYLEGVSDIKDLNKKLFDSITLHPAAYGDKPPYELIDKETEVYILDFSYPVQDLVFIAEESHRTVLLDHHKTAMESLAEAATFNLPNLQINFDMNRSGAMMAWEYFNSGKSPAPLLIQHIQDRDLWKFNLSGTRAFHFYLSMQEQTIEKWTELNNCIENLSDMDEGSYHEMMIEGKAIEKYYDSTVDSIIKATKRPITINGLIGLCCSCNHMFASDVGNILAKESGTYGASMFQDSKGDVKFSLRSIGDYDVSAIAKVFGGGGHKNAAGFTLTNPQEAYNGLVTVWNDQFKKLSATEERAANYNQAKVNFHDKENF